jgi:hypothetical protein
MANNAITRAIQARRPKPVAPPPPPGGSPADDEISKQANALVDPYAKQRQAGMAQRFSGLEQKLFSQELGRGQREADILERRFAALGGQAGKATEQRAFELAGKEAGRRLDIGQSEIEQERLAQESALGEELAQMRMQAGERLRSQDFARQEREAAQAFQKEQSALDRALKEQEIGLAQKELDINTQISLENISSQYKGQVPQAIIDRLRKAGMSEDVLAMFEPQKPAATKAKKVADKLEQNQIDIYSNLQDRMNRQQQQMAAYTAL